MSGREKGIFNSKRKLPPSRFDGKGRQVLSRPKFRRLFSGVPTQILAKSRVIGKILPRLTKLSTNKSSVVLVWEREACRGLSHNLSKAGDHWKNQLNTIAKVMNRI